MQLEPHEVTVIRQQLGLKKHELSRRLGLQEDAVRAWENGNKRCTGANVVALRLIAALNETRVGRAVLERVLP